MNRERPPPTPQTPEPFPVRVKRLEALSAGHNARLIKLEKQRDMRDGLPIVALIMSVVATLIAVAALVLR